MKKYIVSLVTFIFFISAVPVFAQSASKTPAAGQGSASTAPAYGSGATKKTGTQNAVTRGSEKAKKYGLKKAEKKVEKAMKRVEKKAAKKAMKKVKKAGK